jgi:hypothetical protein
MRFFVLMTALVLSSCGSGNDAPGEKFAADAKTTVDSASNENFARLIAAGGVSKRCINMAGHYGLISTKERVLDGYIEFSTDPYVNPAPPFILAMVEKGILKHEGLANRNGREVNVYRATEGNRGLFRWFDNRRGATYLCPGVLYVDVVSYTEPAEQQGRTQARFRYRVSDIPASIQEMMDSGMIPSGPAQNMLVNGTVTLEGEGTTSLVKTNKGWELSEGEI